MNDITVIIPTSPIPAHPSTRIIETVLASVRRHLPDEHIHVLCDGVRPELEHRRRQYEEYVRNMGHWRGYGQLMWEIHKEHRHQAGMVKDALADVRTPFFFFCEHDCVLDERPIDWEAIKKLLYSGDANTVRLYWHETIHPEHTHLMSDRVGDFVKTIQWSGWPFIGRVDFYQKLLDQYFGGDASSQMLESGLYGPVLASPWEDFKTWIYCKPDRMGVTFRHLNGRVDPETGARDFGDW